MSLSHDNPAIQDAINHERWTLAARLLKPLAKEGNTEAMYQCGLVCFHQANGDLDLAAKGFTWCEQAAERGHLKAMLYLAYAYQVGHGVRKSLATSRRFFSECAEQGSVEAMYKLGCMHLDGVGGKIEIQKGLDVLTRAAQSFPSVASYEIAEPATEADSFHQFLRGDETNSAVMAQECLGRFYVDPDDDSTPDIELAIKWLAQAINNGLLDEGVTLARLYQKNGDIEAAKSILRKCIAANDAQAMYQLAQILTTGNLNDVLQAEMLYEQAAATGNSAARYALEMGFSEDISSILGNQEFSAKDLFHQARAYHLGNPRDDRAAARLYYTARRAGYIPARAGMEELVTEIGEIAVRSYLHGFV